MDINKIKQAIEIARLLDDQPTANATPNGTERAVVVFTDKRGVFFGYTTATDLKQDVVLSEARNCYYWSAPTTKHKGFLGLAEIGPQSGSKVSGANSKPVTVSGVTCIAECTEQAIKAWEDSSWNS